MKGRCLYIAALLMVISLAAPAVLPLQFGMGRAAAADPGLMKWQAVQTPGSFPGKNDNLTFKIGRGDILNPQFPVGSDIAKGSDILDMAVLGGTLKATIRTWWINSDYETIKLSSTDNGISGTIESIGLDYKTISGTDDGGISWNVIFNGKKVLELPETIRYFTVSPSYKGKNNLNQIDIGIVTVGGSNGGRWITISNYDGTQAIAQSNPNGTPVNPLTEPHTDTNSGLEYLALKFSPNYAQDGAVALVYADNTSTYYNVALRDLDTNTTQQFAFPSPGIEVKNPVSAPGASPNWDQLNNVDIQLPSDFSGQSASLRRAYISLDAYGSGNITATGVPLPKLADAQDGIYRIDDATPYLLMDTSKVADKSIYSLAYYGTYASGKLLAGERTGYPCAATVPTWFTDSPTTCPIPCWYPALKPPTGAGNQGVCAPGSKTGMGAAIVDWKADGSLAFAATGSLPCTVYAGQAGHTNGSDNATTADRRKWYQMQEWDPVPNDESALSISRNNGETWNQISLIDTTVDWFNDVVASPDCTTLYLASANRHRGTGCNEFDSVWRATLNPYVSAPLPCMPPIGSYWERVLTRPTSGSCDSAQGALASDNRSGVMAWSPDFGDYWAMIGPRFPVQDFAFESSTTLYVVSAGGLVQRLPYTGTSWSTNLSSCDTTLLSAHTIVAMPDGKLLAGAGSGATFSIAYSADKGVTFMNVLDTIPGQGNQHAIFDVDFKGNSFIYMGDDNYKGQFSAPGTVYRNTVPAFTRWVDGDLMSPANGCGYIFDNVTFSGLAGWPAGGAPPHPVGQFGLVQAWTGSPQPALYSAHDNITTSTGRDFSAACRTLTPRDGLPKPGIYWDCLDIYRPADTAGVKFTLEPSSLKACGCCTLDSATTLYAIDDQSGNWEYIAGAARNYLATRLKGRFNGDLFTPPKLGYTPSKNKGLLWTYTDCLAKKPPVLKTPADKYLVGADPVTGRNQQVDLAWEQLCLSTAYQLQVAKDKDFTRRINPTISNARSINAVYGSILMEMDEVNMTSPAAWIAPGALPEAGAVYWWRVRSARSATGQLAASPWSAARSFSVRPGFITTSPYYGPQLLSPSNGCMGCPVRPVAFSWSPYKEATLYRFELATDAAFKQVVAADNTTSTAYQFSGGLNYSTNFFWRVRALQVNGLDIPGDWSAAFTFRTADAPPPAAPPPGEPQTPIWVWAVFATGAILAAVILVLIYRTRRWY